MVSPHEDGTKPTRAILIIQSLEMLTVRGFRKAMVGASQDIRWIIAAAYLRNTLNKSLKLQHLHILCLYHAH